MAIWVCADLHLQDKNLVSFCRTQFKTINEHDEYVINKYNSVVGQDDLVYILGDVGHLPKDTLTTKIKRLKGRKILVVGNHDKLKDNEYIMMGFIQVIRHPIYYSSKIVFSHEPAIECLNSPFAMCVHGHIHNNKLDLPNFVNVNVEMNDYLPINITTLVEMADRICEPRRWEPFGQEWYHPYYFDKEEAARGFKR